jgi:predicted HTH transcriptional regulator
LLKAAYSVLEAINIYNATAVEITYPNRVETSLVDPTALREAALNALIHNDYTGGVEPVFEFYDDRVKITSYGGLPAGLTHEEFFGGCSLPRNREIMRIFKDMELGERLGSGMCRIMQVYGKNNFEISQNFLSVVFKYNSKAFEWIKDKKTNGNGIGENGDGIGENAGSIGENGESIGENIGENAGSIGENESGIGENGENGGGIGENADNIGANDTQRKILGLMDMNPKISAKAMAAAIGISPRNIEENIKRLKENGVVKRNGSDKGGFWEILR